MENWTTLSMVDVCDLITCGVAARPEYVDEGVPFLSAKNVKNGEVIYSGYNCIAQETHQELTKKNKPLLGDILYTRVGSYGEAAVIEEDIEFSVFVSLTLIKPKKSILNNYYLKYYLNSSAVKSIAKASITSSGVGNLNVGSVRKFPVPIPPLPEQKRIVAKLDQAFIAIDQAKAKVERNLQNAKDLFQSELNKIFSQEQGNTSKRRLGDLCTITSSKRIFKAEYVEKGVPYYRSKEIKELANGKKISVKLYIDRDKYTSIKHQFGVPAVGDVLITAIGATIGEIYVVENNDEFYFKDGNVLWLKYFESLNTNFLKYALSSFISKIISGAQGSAYNALTIEKLKEHLIPLPTQLAQNKIVERLDDFKSKTTHLNTNYQKELNAFVELKKSILQKAFNGEL